MELTEVGDSGVGDSDVGDAGVSDSGVGDSRVEQNARRSSDIFITLFV